MRLSPDHDSGWPTLDHRSNGSMPSLSQPTPTRRGIPAVMSFRSRVEGALARPLRRGLPCESERVADARPRRKWTPKLDPAQLRYRRGRRPESCRDAGVLLYARGGIDNALSGANPNRPPRSGKAIPHEQKTAANRAVRTEVGAVGFEPTTFRPPAECATRLRHAPVRVSLRRPTAARSEAGDGTRTRFLQLGRLMCNQLHLARERSDYRFASPPRNGPPTCSGRRSRRYTRPRFRAHCWACRRRTRPRSRGRCRSGSCCGGASSASTR
jgi:hypothetical protein